MRWAIYGDHGAVGIYATASEARRAARTTPGYLDRCDDATELGDPRPRDPQPRSPGRPPTGPALTVRLSREDRDRLADIRYRMELLTDADAIRYAIRHVRTG